MKIDKIPPMFDNLHGSVHNDIEPTKRAGKDKFVKNKKKNYCDKKGECISFNSDELKDDGCKHYMHCDCNVNCKFCFFIDPENEACVNHDARKEAGVI